MQDMTPDATSNLWENKLQGELAAAQGALTQAQNTRNNAQTNVDSAQSTLDSAQNTLNNVSGWDKFWNTKKHKNAKSARDAASTQLGYTQNVLKDADRELALAQAEVERINKLIGEILNAPVRHSGGFVSETPALKSNEQFAKLLKTEFVTTPQQMDNFIRRTLPALAGRVGGSQGATFNSPLINLHVASVTKDTLPDVKRIVEEAVDRIKGEFDSNFSRAGQRRSVNRFVAV
jgi:multidrug efflux pump subunit AcrA (membrane-fusion protein)